MSNLLIRGLAGSGAFLRRRTILSSTTLANDVEKTIPLWEDLSTGGLKIIPLAVSFLHGFR
jgi:hypothetical protein